MLDVIAWMFIAVPLLNTYFAWRSMVTHRLVSPRSPLLRSIMIVGLVLWGLGIYMAVTAARFLVGAPAFPFGGIGLGIAILTVLLLPAFVWLQMRRFVIAEARPDAVVTIDESSIIVFANPAAYELFGWELGTLEGKPLGLIQPDRFRAAHLAAFPHYLRTGVRTLDWNGVHVAGLRQDGSQFPIVIMLHEHVVEGQRLFTAIIRAEHDQP